MLDIHLFIHDDDDDDGDDDYYYYAEYIVIGVSPVSVHGAVWAVAGLV